LINRISGIREKAYRFIQQELDERGFAGVRPSHGNLLWILFQSDQAPSMTEVVRKAGRSKSTVSVSLRNLEKHGYLTLRTDPEDSRGIRIYLTVKGQSLERDFNEISESLNGLLAEGIGEEEMEQAASLLRMVDDNLKKCLKRKM